MARRQVYHDEEILLWYESAIGKENVRRANKGLVALSELDLLRIVLARFAGLPVIHDVDLGVVRGSKDGFWTPPKTATKRAAKKTTTSDMTTPPHGGRSKKAPAKDTTSNMTTRPHGGKTAAKRTSKKAPATAQRWTPPHGG